MSNPKVTMRVQVLYQDAYSQNAAIQATIEPEYQSQVHGSFDIPESTAAGPFSIPFGSVDGATAVLIRNLTGQDVDVDVNGGDLAYPTLPDGKSFLLAFQAGAGGTPITAVTVTTTTTMQVGGGHIAYDVWGDPV